MGYELNNGDSSVSDFAIQCSPPSYSHGSQSFKLFVTLLCELRPSIGFVGKRSSLHAVDQPTCIWWLSAKLPMMSLWVLICAFTSIMAIESAIRGHCVSWTGYPDFHWPAFQKGFNNLKRIWLMVGLWMFINRRRSSVRNRVEWLGPIGHAYGHWPFPGDFPEPSIGLHEHFHQIRLTCALPALWSKFICPPTNVSACIFLQILFRT